MGVGEGSGRAVIKLRTPDEVRERLLERFVSYKRQSTAVGLMWTVFTCAFVVINVIVFIQPQWVHRLERSSMGHQVPGYFGLYERCELRDSGFTLHCEGKFNNFATIPHPAFRASTFFVGVSCLIIWICIACFFLFFIVKPRTVFIACGSLQFVSAVFMSLACLIFPAGWNDPSVSRICGSGSDQYILADCHVGWAYILAMVGTFAIIFLSLLAFVLAGRQLELSDTPLGVRNLPATYRNGTDLRNKKDQIPDDEDSLRPTMFITPGGISPPDGASQEQDCLSEFSQSTKKSFRSDFAL